MNTETYVVLAHGFMQDARTWDEVRAALPANIKAIAPTLRPTDAGHATLGDLADQVKAASPAGRPAVYVGYSMGGRVLQEYARRYPETLQAVILESAGTGPESEDERAAFAKRNREWADRFVTANSREDVVDWWESLPLFQSQKGLSAATRRKSREMRLSCDPQQLAWLTRFAGAHTMPLAARARTELAALPCPVFYLYGRRDTKYAKTARALDSEGIATIAFDTGHNVHMEQPQLFAEQIVRIVSAAEAWNQKEGRK